jgi:hypothetical protein
MAHIAIGIFSSGEGALSYLYQRRRRSFDPAAFFVS